MYLLVASSAKFDYDIVVEFELSYKLNYLLMYYNLIIQIYQIILKIIISDKMKEIYPVIILIIVTVEKLQMEHFLFIVLCYKKKHKIVRK